jgi:hypothetical protein
VGVGGAQDAFVAAGLGEAQLVGAGYAAGWAEEFWSWRDAEDFFGLFEVAEEVDGGVEHKGAVGDVVIADFMSGGFDAGDQAGMAQGALADQEKRGVGVVLLENFEDLRCEDGVWAVIEGEGDERMAGADAVGEIWSQPLEQRQDDWRLDPEEE